jgi:hypothetical protein
MNETEHRKLIAKQKASVVVTHLAFVSADHTNCSAAKDAFVKAKSTYEKALADEGK